MLSTLRTKCVSTFLVSAATVFAADFITGQAARLVVGQQTFTAQDPASSATTVGGVSGLAYAAGYLFVADSNRVGAEPSNHRVLLFPSGQFPSPGTELDYVRKCPVCLGQASVVMGRQDFSPFDITVDPLPPATQTSLRLPTSVASDGVHVVIADTDHNRVLIWNRIPNLPVGNFETVHPAKTPAAPTGSHGSPTRGAYSAVSGISAPISAYG